VKNPEAEVTFFFMRSFLVGCYTVCLCISLVTEVNQSNEPFSYEQREQNPLVLLPAQFARRDGGDLALQTTSRQIRYGGYFVSAKAFRMMAGVSDLRLQPITSH